MLFRSYLQDYPIEQYIRDAKIDSLYEGTTAIQGQDFFFRKIVKNNGAALGEIANQVQASLSAESADDRLKEERELLSQALEDAQAIFGAMIEHVTAAQEDLNNVYKVGQHAVTLLMSMGDLLIGWLLYGQAEIALRNLDGSASAKDQPFYQGKVAAARFFAKNVLPELSSRRKVVENADNSLMDVDEAAF